MSTDAQVNPYAPPQADLEGAGAGMDTTFQLNLFSPAGRIGRIRYLGYTMGLALLIMVVGGVLAAVTTPLLFVVPYLAVLYVQIMLTIKRSHDCNWSGWAALLMFIPVVSLVFLFVPGTDGANRFGNKTAPNGNSALVVVAIFVGIALIGILAAIAIPAYQDYLHRAQAAQLQAH
jgi:uncharacterized membrane protein YhaH (DUF805 family)